MKLKIVKTKHANPYIKFSYFWKCPLCSSYKVKNDLSINYVMLKSREHMVLKHLADNNKLKLQTVKGK